MMIFDHLLQLFQPEDPPPDDPQDCREAMVDLLVWTMFVDHHLALAEKEVLDGQTSDLEWTGRVSLDDFLRESTSRARSVIEGGPPEPEAYLANIRDRLQHAVDRRRVLKACREMVSSDGRLRPEEARHLKAVERMFEL